MNTYIVDRETLLTIVGGMYKFGIISSEAEAKRTFIGLAELNYDSYNSGSVLPSERLTFDTDDYSISELDMKYLINSSAKEKTIFDAIQEFQEQAVHSESYSDDPDNLKCNNLKDAILAAYTDKMPSIA